tara:strand:- start:301 stop:765 length:465 start_codon:yes stop_codon:yes gene_type:complete
MFKRFYDWFRKDNAGVNVQQREAEQVSEKFQELIKEKEQKNIDSVSRQSEKNQEKGIKSIEFKINESENGYLSPEVLQIDGASYIEGMDDYEWIFQIAKKDFGHLLKLLKETDQLSDDVPTELMSYLKENGTKVAEIRDLCAENDIEHYFANYM